MSLADFDSHGGRSTLARLAMLAVAAIGAAPVSSAVADDVVLPIFAVFVSDDDGGRSVPMTPEQVTPWVEFANNTYRPAGIRFEYDPGRAGRPGDWMRIRSTLLNRMEGTSQADWLAARAEGDRVAAEHPGRLVVFFRYGPMVTPTGAGFSWIDYNFVVMPGWQAAGHCDHPHTDALAHEVGHFLGLPHTFAFADHDTLEQAEARFKRDGRNQALFDGDGIADTPPDPLVRQFECDRGRATLSLDGVSFTLPRRNIMSYYDERDSLSPMQIKRVRWIAGKRLEGGMALPVNTPRPTAAGATDLSMATMPATGPTTWTSPASRTAGAADAAGRTIRIELESLPVLEAHNCSVMRQEMDGYGAGNWSASAQLFCGAGAARDASVRLRLRLERGGEYDVTLFATQAPDFSRIAVALDGKLLGTVVDLYAPLVMPSGPVPLATRKLPAGDHELAFRVAGKNPDSTQFSFGVDCIEFVERR